MGADSLAVGTIVTKNYFAFARVLAQSFHRHHPTIPFYVLLVDEVDDCFYPESEPFRLVALDELTIPDRQRFLFRYSRGEVVFAAKPMWMRHLLDRGYSRVMYLDADMLVLDELTNVIAQVAAHDLTLAPHVLGPLDDPSRELNFLLTGVFNAGFLGASGEARHFLDWWHGRVAEHCRHALAEGVFYDQRWLDLGPCFVHNYGVIRDTGFNVAYWNVSERIGQAVQCFHFSGFNPDRLDTLSRYAEGFPHDTERLAQQYGALLRDAGHDTCKDWPFAYDHFDNGVPIPSVARRLFAANASAFENPFVTAGAGTFYRWLQQSAASLHLTRLWQAVYDERPDVQCAFPDPGGKDRSAFLHWASEQGIHSAFTPFVSPVIPPPGTDLAHSAEGS